MDQPKDSLLWDMQALLWKKNKYKRRSHLLNSHTSIILSKQEAQNTHKALKTLSRRPYATIPRSSEHSLFPSTGHQASLKTLKSNPSHIQSSISTLKPSTTARLHPHSSVASQLHKTAPESLIDHVNGLRTHAWTMWGLQWTAPHPLS